MPDLSPSVLHILLDDSLLPTGSPVAEIRLEQVMAAHGLETGIDRALLALVNLVHGGLHIVVDATPGYAAEGGKGTGVGIEQHFMALREVRYQPEGTRRGQLDVRHFQAPA